jgi:ribosomal-protein-alanine N-acetyltransferase
MIKGSNFVRRHIVSTDLSALIPLLNDPDVRGEYLPNAIQSPVELEKKIQTDGMANESLVRFVAVEQQSNSVIGTLWHAKAVPYFNARDIGYTLSNEYGSQGI